MSNTLTSATPIASQLRAVAANAAGASRLLHDRRVDAVWQALGLTVEPIAGPAGAPLYLLRMNCTAGEFSLAIAIADDASAALAADADLSEPLRSLAAEAWFDTAAQQLAGAGWTGVHALALAPLAAGAVPRDGWCVLRTHDRELARFAMQSLPASVHEMLRSVAASTRARSAAALRTSLSLPGSAALGVRAVSIDALRTLKPGDVLLLPASPAALENASVRLAFGPRGGRRLTVAARIQAQSIIVEGEPRMTDDDDHDNAEGSADALGELELPVSFEIETVSVPLAELEAIAPGYVIELAMPVADARLRLVSCGQVIGHADLVAIGDRLGARITRMVVRDDIQPNA